MEGINKKYNLEIEVLTPLSIGAGAEKDWVRGIDFVVDKGKLYKLRIKKMVEFGIKPEDLSYYFCSKNEAGLISKLGSNLSRVSDLIINIPAKSDNDVKSFVKNQLTGNPILTGSSIKGAIRSVLFQYFGGYTGNGKEVFGSSTDGDEFMRFVELSDAEFKNTSLVNTKIFNLQNQGGWMGGWKHGANNTDSDFKATGFNTIYECLMPGQQGFSAVKLSATLYDQFASHVRPHIKSEKKSLILHNDISILFGIINKHTKDYLKKERDFFSQFEADRTDDIIDSIDKLLSMIPNNNSYCVLKMSAGSGFHSITGDWQFGDYTKAPLDRKRNINGNVNPKSRKIAVWDNNLSLMGFVKLRALSDEETSKLEGDRKADIQRKEQEAKALRKAAEMEAQQERERAEREAKARREAEIIEAQKRRELEERKRLFDALIEAVKQLCDTEQYEMALEKYEDAIKTYPEFEQDIVNVVDLRDKVSKVRKANNGLSVLLNEKYDLGPNVGKYKVQTFKVCSQKVQSWQKAAGVSKLPIEQYPYLHDTIQRLSSEPDKNGKKDWQNFSSKIWKQIADFVGDVIAKQWFEEIQK